PTSTQASGTTGRRRTARSRWSRWSDSTRPSRVKTTPPAQQRSNLRRVPDLSHLWQRFVLAAALVFGLALGVAATIFGYSNTGTVDIAFSVFHLRGIPLWSVAIVPLVVVLAAGTLYHWWNSLHHFSEHMRHRRRVKELEAELASLKARLDELLEMPGHA